MWEELSLFVQQYYYIVVKELRVEKFSILTNIFMSVIFNLLIK